MALSPHIQTTVPLAAGLFCAVMAGIIWIPLNATPKLAEPVAQNTAPAGPSANDVLAAGAEDLLARPLFHMTRRPPVVATPVQPAPVIVTLSLTGVVKSNDDNIAILRLSNSTEVFRRRVGERLGNWEITDITESSVEVTKADGSQEVISLNQNNP